ncbi:CPBP family intramembrane glutamic endopeptidase [Burkholderia territorii]|uniref:CPBP family intramembrane glutamic endopeptidase n=1 Tax=Burkholderia territorii TaxID=1503055 RepID=UPI0009C08430|nr:CPBP family intramembrane glutamic endopeptidase [Burkholderia territorii]
MDNPAWFSTFFLLLVVGMFGFAPFLQSFSCPKILDLIFSILTGATLFSVGIFFIRGRNASQITRFFVDAFSTLRFSLTHLWIFVGAYIEEMVWRVYIQTTITFRWGWVGIPLSALFFFFIHPIAMRPTEYKKAGELLFFSLVLSYAWSLTNNVWIVTVIHYVRNALILGLILAESEKPNRDDPERSSC